MAFQFQLFQLFQFLKSLCIDLIMYCCNLKILGSQFFLGKNDGCFKKNLYFCA